VPKLMLYVEVAGCPTTCMHCWAQGRRYPTMPLADVARVVAESHRFCERNGLSFDAYPMHEVAAHPDAAEVMRLFRAHVAPTLFEPLSTTGVPIAQRDDWLPLLDSLRESGTTTAWLAFHGVGAEHDRRVSMPGAFEQTCRGAERIRAAGLRVGCNVFLTKANAAQIPELAETLERLGVVESFWAPAGFGPQPRVRRYEALRPELGDLLPHADRVAAITAWRGVWRTLADYTEAAHVRRATAGEWTSPHPPTDATTLVCRPNLDVHLGMAGLYRRRLGNLRSEGVEPVLRRALEAGPLQHERLWFDLVDPPPDAELAARYGDRNSQRLHFYAGSVRNVWLDRAARGLAA
jgi:hypothetical protein